MFRSSTFYTKLDELTLLLIASLSTLVLATTAPTYANEVATNSSNANLNVVEITPFNLVHRGYQGSLPGKIPSNGAFYTAVHSGKIKASDLVQSAIASGRLSQDKLKDQSYLRAVQTQLDNFNHN